MQAMTDPDGRIENAERLCALQRCDDAVALWEEASTRKPGDPGLHYQLGLCHSRDCHGHGLRDPEIAIYHYRRALALTPRGDRLARAMLLSDLGNTYLLSTLPAETRSSAAIDCFEQAAGIYREAERFDDWAREEFNLGNVWCELPEAAFPAKWEKAAAHFEQALSIRTRERDPQRYAATLQNLGTAYRELKSGDRRANIRRAIHCYHQTLRALGGLAASRRAADLHQNLGNAYLDLALDGEDRVRNLRRALRHLDRALALRTREQSPFHYAATQLSRGEAFLRAAITGLGAGAASLAQARVCFEEARDGFTESGEAHLAGAAQQRLELIARTRDP